MEDIGQIIITLNFKNWMWYIVLGYTVAMLLLTVGSVYLKYKLKQLKELE